MISEQSGFDNHFISEQFFRRMGSRHQFHFLFDEIGEVFFFAKDTQGRFVAMSRATAVRLGLDNSNEGLGKTDADFYPPHIASRIRQDDDYVMHTGSPIRNRLEIWYSKDRDLDWFTTTKFPVYSEEGDIAGIMGVVRDYREQELVYGEYQRIAPAIEYIRNHLEEPITVGILAERCRVSDRQLNRWFESAFCMSPKEFLTKTRLQTACNRLTHSYKRISAIAAELGFSDQAAMSRCFQQHLGISPSQFRSKYFNL